MIFSSTEDAGYQTLRKLMWGSVVAYTSESEIARKAVRASAEERELVFRNWKFGRMESHPWHGELERKMTFFYTDKGEYYNLLPIAREAESRGYIVRFTENIKEKAVIGIYCQHVCFPENSEFSAILLHDMAQGHNRWPNLWELEPWDGFDLGILPGEMWADLWKICGSLYYANPKCGTYVLGYPKSDLVYQLDYTDSVKLYREKMKLKYPVSVLYAPSWENDEKEDDFVRALASLDVNLLIKQAHWNPVYSGIIHNIEEMERLHRGRYENLYYIEPEENIMTALGICDLVVSDESSVMAEALLFDKPSIAIEDWTIPDCTPPRKASVPMEYVLRCKKVELRECIEKFLANKLDFSNQIKVGKRLFGNRGMVCRDIVDAIEYFTGNGKRTDFLSKKLIPNFLPFR